MREFVLEVKGVTKDFPVRQGPWRRDRVRAVDNVSFSVERGEIFGLVGESGSGKTTVARCILKLAQVTSGDILVGPIDVRTATGERLRKLRRTVQMVFQDPYSSLDPKMTVGETIAEGLIVHRLMNQRTDREARISQLLEMVGLRSVDADRLPGTMSGGQRQRVGIARALAVEPELLVCDEPVSSLDVSIQAQILNLICDLRERLGLSVVFIAHNLAIVKFLCDRCAVMSEGRIREMGTCDEIFSHPQDSYTKDLLAAVPIPDPRLKQQSFGGA